MGSSDKFSKSRSILIFEQYVQSEKTRENYLYNLERFAKYYQLDSIEKILELENFKEKIEDYVIVFKNNGKSVSYIRNILFALQSFCEANDYDKINWKRIRRLLGKPQKPKKSRPYSTDEIRSMLSVTTNLRNKAVILFLTSSGVRRGALTELMIRNLKEMPNGCLAITVYEDSNEEYITFINAEAKHALTKYFDVRKKDGESLEGDHPVFRTKYRLAIEKPKVISDKVISNLIFRVKTKAGVNLEDSPNMLCHAFRRRFNTVLKLNSSINHTIIERLMGHDMKLDNSYFQPSLDDLFTEYQKGVPDLTIDDKTRVLEEIKALESEKLEIIKVSKENKNQEVEIDRLSKEMEEIRNQGQIMHDLLLKMQDEKNEKKKRY